MYPLFCKSFAQVVSVSGNPALPEVYIITGAPPSSWARPKFLKYWFSHKNILRNNSIGISNVYITFYPFG